jgi:hypothetical protein
MVNRPRTLSFTKEKRCLYINDTNYTYIHLQIIYLTGVTCVSWSACRRLHALLQAQLSSLFRGKTFLFERLDLKPVRKILLCLRVLPLLGDG